jgi:hypothetical protein
MQNINNKDCNREISKLTIRTTLRHFFLSHHSAKRLFWLKKISQVQRGLAQAAVEMAVLGSLILFVFSICLTYVQRMDAQLELKMEAFRKALNRAYARNASVSYTVKKDKRFYNLMANWGESQPSTLAASSTVMWQKGLAGCQHGQGNCENRADEGTGQSAFAYYEVNNHLLGVPDNEVLGQDVMLPRYVKRARGYIEEVDEWKQIKVPVSVWKDVSYRTNNYNIESRKQEEAAEEGTPSSIDNRQSLDINENVYTRIFVRFDDADSDEREDVHTPEYVYEGGELTYDENNVWSPTETYPSGFAREGAYYNPDTNRIEYDPDIPENSTTTVWRNWHTNF